MIQNLYHHITRFSNLPGVNISSSFEIMDVDSEIAALKWVVKGLNGKAELKLQDISSRFSKLTPRAAKSPSNFINLKCLYPEEYHAKQLAEIAKGLETTIRLIEILDEARERREKESKA